MAQAPVRRLEVVGRTVDRIWSHPENRRRRLRRLAAWAGWQAHQRILHTPRTVPFEGGLSIVCRPHDPVSSGVIYCGLPDHEEMRFLLAWLQPGDTFVDVGANVGLYSLLAAGVAGADTVAFEPSSQTATWLRENIALNGLLDRVEVVQKAVAEVETAGRLSVGEGPVNRLVSGEGVHEAVDVVTLDGWLGSRRSGMKVALVKIDVEGHELNVLAGARTTIDEARPPIIVEINDPPGLRRFCDDHGYACVRFDAVEGRLGRAPLPTRAGGNAILVPDDVAAAGSPRPS